MLFRILKTLLSFELLSVFQNRGIINSKEFAYGQAICFYNRKKNEERNVSRRFLKYSILHNINYSSNVILYIAVVRLSQFCVL